jgi:hypothetical protein
MRAAIQEPPANATCLRRWHGYGAPCVSSYGRFDAAFNNAGVNSDSAAFLETSDDV